MARIRCLLQSSAALVICLSAGMGQAAECLQKQAIYTDDAKAYTLSFSPVTSEAAAISHQFTVKIVASGEVMNGNVMTLEDVPRPFGTLLYKCPEGDVTGDDIAACTIWQGVIYDVSTAGAVAVLPDADSVAAQKILLPDFGPSLRQSSLWESGKATVAPWDVFDFTGCAS
jgi:hypothetical protein